MCSEKIDFISVCASAFTCSVDSFWNDLSILPIFKDLIKKKLMRKLTLPGVESGPLHYSKLHNDGPIAC
jgi:hypothetical protein